MQALTEPHMANKICAKFGNQKVVTEKIFFETLKFKKESFHGNLRAVLKIFEPKLINCFFSTFDGMAV